MDDEAWARRVVAGRIVDSGVAKTGAWNEENGKRIDESRSDDEEEKGRNIFVSQQSSTRR